MDFDPRDCDSGDDERHTRTPSRGGRSGSGGQDRDHDWRQPDAPARDRDDHDARSPGRGPGMIGRRQRGIEAATVTIPAGPTEIATIENAIARSRIPSPATITCHLDRSANWVPRSCGESDQGRPQPSREPSGHRSGPSPDVLRGSGT